jgi:uncharacterized protein with HEPN domain
MGVDRDGLYLVLISEAIADIRRRLIEADYTQFLTDRDEQALAAFRLSIIGENANKLSVELKERHPRLPWPDMVAFRNIVSHEYHRVDPELVWQATLALGDLENMVDKELTDITSQGQ